MSAMITALPNDKIVAHDSRSYIEVRLYDDGQADVDLHGAMIARHDLTGSITLAASGEADLISIRDSFSNELVNDRLAQAAVNHARRLRRVALREARTVVQAHRKATADGEAGS